MAVQRILGGAVLAVVLELMVVTVQAEDLKEIVLLEAFLTGEAVELARILVNLYLLEHMVLGGWC
ncbi:hypothetical protein [Sodalis glossinidius]|uniref:hypothetical protein n=1 Tax=Sodalis glossinidius TaxID=63612 RepID=UPI0005A4AFA2|nr:hypothetical protein [Sodalis glossinidius]